MKLPNKSYFICLEDGVVTDIIKEKAGHRKIPMEK